MHASRTVLWALRMHKLLQKLTPGYVNTSLESISTRMVLDQESIFEGS